MPRLPPLSAVRVFEAAARHQNFTQAATELGMTQAAVSYQIRLLEERLGLALFARHKGRVSLTEAGRRAAPAVSAGFEAIADAFAAMVADDSGVLTVSTTATFASNWLAPRLGSFQLARPELAVRLNTDNSIVDFARAEIDLGIRSTSGAADWPGLKAHFLFRLHSTPLCSPDFRDRHPVETPADLLNVPRLSQDDIWWADWFRAAGVAVPVETVPTGIRFDTQAMEGNAALAGAGASVLTPMFWRGELAAGRLVQLFALTSFEGPGYWLVYPEYKRNQPKIAAFREWLLAQVEAEKAREPPEVFVAP
ncbi:MAG TPA: LysR substrate-binding domain-containing protein [Allosphingosinicella sp.]|nr:LysR substrate-binding domain-containing protein [Allosphingosinicella sp.]